MRGLGRGICAEELIPARDHLLDIYLPGVICRSTGGTPAGVELPRER